ncbi:otolith matrix protein OMM-64 [Aplysia californica]|uniref:Otolith matrix protein OMM-64 n=1 Tax=Aplysia californica TaxID=6500 RepID=A0ABM1A5E2_APLCA|nr:otolith matrix protein OMM-64 [Aplysia californica]
MFFSEWQEGVLANDTEEVCYGDVVCEDECCHDMDFGIPYCCSKYTGFIYLGLMVGGGVIIAVLVIACYVFMRRTERELEAAARLEAAKASSRNGSRETLTSDTDQTDLDSTGGDANDNNRARPPPAYSDVMRTFTRCHSCDVAGSSTRVMRADFDVIGMLARQHSEGSQMGGGLPPLVDVAALLARHRQEAEQMQNSSSLPPLMSTDVLESKLPTYEECVVTRRSEPGGACEYSIRENFVRSKELDEAQYRLEQCSDGAGEETEESVRNVEDGAVESEDIGSPKLASDVTTSDTAERELDVVREREAEEPAAVQSCQHENEGERIRSQSDQNSNEQTNESDAVTVSTQKEGENDSVEDNPSQTAQGTDDSDTNTKSIAEENNNDESDDVSTSDDVPKDTEESTSEKDIKDNGVDKSPALDSANLHHSNHGEPGELSSPEGKAIPNSLETDQNEIKCDDTSMAAVSMAMETSENQAKDDSDESENKI